MKKTPDYVYDPNDWEVTLEWVDRSYLVEELGLGVTDNPVQFGTLIQGLPVWVKEVVISRDEDGEPDETEIQWFDSLEEATKA